jgi:hypothetical protein
MTRSGLESGRAAVFWLFPAFDDESGACCWARSPFAERLHPGLLGMPWFTISP